MEASTPKVRNMKPSRSVWVSVPYAKRSLDVSLWDGEEKDGKYAGSKVSLRLKRDAESPKGFTAPGRQAESGSGNIFAGESVFLHPADALKLAGLLQRFAVDALESDSLRRRELWSRNSEEKSVSLTVPVPA